MKDAILDLSRQLESGAINSNEFITAVNELRYTEYSMQQGELGNPDLIAHIQNDEVTDFMRMQWRFPNYQG